MLLENMSIFAVLKVFFHDLMNLPIKYGLYFFYLEMQKWKEQINELHADLMFANTHLLWPWPLSLLSKMLALS